MGKDAVLKHEIGEDLTNARERAGRADVSTFGVKVTAGVDLGRGGGRVICYETY
jgi:hypothetical protein